METDPITDSYVMAKQLVARHVLGSSLAGWLTNVDTVLRALDGEGSLDLMTGLGFADGDITCCLKVGHRYDPHAGVRTNAAGDEMQCCSLAFSVTWSGPSSTDLRRQRTCLKLWSDVVALAEQLQGMVDAMGPTWVTFTTREQVVVRDAAVPSRRRKVNVRPVLG